MQITKNTVLKRTHKKPILIDSYYLKDQLNQPVVIFCHGYKGFKDWGAWNVMATAIAKTGCCFMKFNFSHNGGTIKNPEDFPDLEAFGNNNYTKELDDLSAVIDWTQDYYKENTAVNTNNISVIGHSRGGGIALIKASEDPRITKLITLASICDFEKRTATVGDLKQWKESGVKYVLNGRTQQQMPHYYQFYEDFIENKKRLHIETAIKRLKIPMLILHGNKDTSIPINEAHNLNKWYPNSVFKQIENADHVFNTKHPWTKDTLSEELNTVTKIIAEFILNK